MTKDIPQKHMIDPDMVYIQGPYEAPEYTHIGITIFFKPISRLLQLTKKTYNFIPNIFSNCLFCEGHLTKKSDVYGFGVVLLEIMSGKRSLDYNRPRWEHNLVAWARPLLINKDKIYQVMDSRIEGQYSWHEATEVARIAIQCLSFSPKNRPNIDDVVRSLEKL